MTTKELQRVLAREVTAKLFAGRTGHGGGPCTSRVLRPEAIEELLVGTMALWDTVREKIVPWTPPADPRCES